MKPFQKPEELDAHILKMLVEDNTIGFAIQTTGGTVRWLAYHTGATVEAVVLSLKRLHNQNKLRVCGRFGDQPLYAPLVQ